jgi:hypothetical protein
MLKTLEALRGAFVHKDVHPLADPRELQRVLAEIPSDKHFKALSEIVGWLESLQGEEMPGLQLFEATRQLDEAAQLVLRRVARDYLHTPRLSRSDEKRLWSISHDYYTLLSIAYERCLLAASQKGRAAEQLKPHLPLICSRLIAALGNKMKWLLFRYGPSPSEIWQRLGAILLLAEVHGVAGKSVQMYPAQPAISTPQLEFTKVVAFHAASMDSLLPLEIEIAERLVTHFLPGYVFSARPTEDSVYWLNLEQPQPPLRMAKLPKEVSPQLRFFKPGAAYGEIESLLHLVESGTDMPVGINLGASYTLRQLLPVLRHLAIYLAPIPPQRSHARHNVKHRMAVVHGLENILALFSPEFDAETSTLEIESWVVENVSQGGFGVQVMHIPKEWLSVGSLIAMQPEGGENWLLGIVRRYSRETESEARVGIQTLARQATPVELKPVLAAVNLAPAAISGLLLQPVATPGEIQLLLPPATFDLRENLEMRLGNKPQILQALALVDQMADYEVARYLA